ncbi:unnamed protein product, partial [Prorocentrum cordatum]
ADARVAAQQARQLKQEIATKQSAVTDLEQKLGKQKEKASTAVAAMRNALTDSTKTKEELKRAQQRLAAEHERAQKPRAGTDDWESLLDGLVEGAAAEVGAAAEDGAGEKADAGIEEAAAAEEGAAADEDDEYARIAKKRYKTPEEKEFVWNRRKDDSIADKQVKYVNGVAEEWLVQCRHCRAWGKQVEWSFQNHDNHVKLHCSAAKRHRQGESTAKAGSLEAFFGRPCKKIKVEAVDASPLPPSSESPTASQVRPPCAGVAPWAILAQVKVDAALQAEFESSCSAGGAPVLAQFWDLLSSTYVQYFKAAAVSDQREGGSRSLRAIRGCGDRPALSRASEVKGHLSDPQMALVHAELVAPFVYTCAACSGLERSMMKELKGCLKNIISGRVLCECLDGIEMHHEKIHRAIKHMHPKNAPMITEGPLSRLRAISAAKLDYLLFKRDDAALLGSAVSSSDVQMLRNLRTLILTNQGKVQQSAIKGSLKAYVCRSMRFARGKGLQNMQYEAAFRNYAVVKWIGGAAGYQFDRANFFDLAAPHERTCQREYQAALKDAGTCNFLDHSRANLVSSMRRTLVAIKARGCSDAVLVADELHNLATLRWDPSLQKYLGLSRKHVMLDAKGFEAASAEKRMPALATKTKFIGVVGLGDAPLYVLLQRPGDADSKEVAAEVGVGVVGMLFDGISKEKDTVVSLFLGNRMLGGLDPKHQFKCLRNACAFGGTAPPAGGLLVVNMECFDALGVRQDCVVIKVAAHRQDAFADFRVRALVDALPLFGTLMSDAALARPTHEVLGTFFFYLQVLFGMAASSSPANALDRRSRIYMSFHSLIFLTGWSVCSVTKMNTILCFGPLGMVLAHVHRIWRWGTGMLEYMFGQYRTRGNGDQLSVQAQFHLAQRLQIFHMKAHEAGFKVGKEAQTYTSTWQSYRDGERGAVDLGPPADEGEVLSLYNKAAKDVKIMFLKLGWRQDDPPRLCQEFPTMVELRTVLEKVLKAPVQEADKAKVDAWHPSEQGRQSKLEQFVSVFHDASRDLVNGHGPEHAASTFVDEFAQDPDCSSEDEVGNELPSDAHEGLELVVDRISNAVRKPVGPALLQSFASVAKDLCGALPREKHKGIANRRTIMERLQLTVPRSSDGAAQASLVDVAIYSPKERSFGRVVLPYRRTNRNFLVELLTDVSHGKRMKELQRRSNVDARITYELIDFSSSHKQGGTTTWALAAPRKKGAARVLSEVSSDLYFVPGENMFPVNMFSDWGKTDGDLVALHANVREFLESECALGLEEKALADARRSSAILHGLSVLSTYAPRVTMAIFRSSELAPTLRKLGKAGSADIAELVKKL